MTAPASKSGGNLRVVVRIRPLSKKERARGCKESITEMNQDYGVDTEGPQVLQVAGHDKRWFEYDAVLGNKSTQEEAYLSSGAQLAVTEDIFKGYNVTLLAYGQTGAGKTYTMGTFGDEDAGILPRACIDLFKSIQEKCDGNGKVELSYLEIYNEEIRDLLSSNNSANPEAKREKKEQLKIRETLNGEVYVSGLTETEVKSPEEIGEILEVAATRRVVGSTAMNAVSSRSHAICTFKVNGVLEGGEKFTSKLSLVDLAGSERIKKTGAQGSRQLEGIHINKSLMVLGQVVSSLASSSSKGRRPPYRDSKLTRLLQDSLGGNSRTLMLACVSPADYNVEESTNTLRYATSARNIKNTATRNIVQQISQEEALALRRENQLLKQQVADLQETLRNMGGISSGGNPATGTGSPTAPLSDDDTDSNLENRGDGAKPQSAGAAAPATPKTPSKSDRRAANAAIQVPALKMEVAKLKQDLAQKNDLEKENDELRQELEDTKMDAEGAKQAANKLSGIMDQLKSLKQDEVNKKQVQLKHKKKEKEWVDFVAKILDRRTDQLKQLREDFELVIKVVESPAVYQTEEKKGWFGRKEFKEIYDPELREKVLKEHVSFFKDRMDEIQNDIFVRAISLQGIKDRIEAQCTRMTEEIDNKQVQADGLDMKEGDVLAKLVDMLIEPNDSAKGRGRKSLGDSQPVGMDQVRPT